MSEGTSRISWGCFLFMMAVTVAELLGIQPAGARAQAVKQSEPQSGPAAKPPWQRLLKGDDARKVESLEKQVVDLEKQGQFAAAVTPAHDVLEIRRHLQGEDHWQTIDARNEEQICKRRLLCPVKRNPTSPTRFADATRLTSSAEGDASPRRSRCIVRP